MEKEKDKNKNKKIGFYVLLSIAIATSILLIIFEFIKQPDIIRLLTNPSYFWNLIFIFIEIVIILVEFNLLKLLEWYIDSKKEFIISYIVLGGVIAFHWIFWLLLFL